MFVRQREGVREREREKERQMMIKAKEKQTEKFVCIKRDREKTDRE